MRVHILRHLYLLSTCLPHTNLKQFKSLLYTQHCPTCIYSFDDRYIIHSVYMYMCILCVNGECNKLTLSVSTCAVFCPSLVQSTQTQLPAPEVVLSTISSSEYKH